MNLNLLIFIGLAGLILVSTMINKLKIVVANQFELRLHYAILRIVFVLAFIQPLLPSNEVFAPAAKVWAAQSIKSFNTDYAKPLNGGYFSLSSPMGISKLRGDRVATTWLGFLGVVFFLGIFNFTRDLRRLFRIKARSYCIRKIGAVRILISQEIRVPFSFWLPGRAYIVVPSGLLELKEVFKISVAHEFQHHRQGDTRWVYVLWGLKLFCIVNPAIHFWNRWVSEIQEFACDETLVDQYKVDSQAYASCLVKVAKHAIDQKHVPVCATGLTLLVERHLLKRRIEKMFLKPSNKIGRPAGLAFGLLLASIMGATAFGSKSLIQDRRINLAQAKEMAGRAQGDLDFPVIVNDLVLKQLNRYMGTPEGREVMRVSLARMKIYKTIVADNLQKYRVPLEIMAVPIIESGYRNLPQGHGGTSLKAAGLWQFIPSTAKNYGLRVDDIVDERLDVSLSTDAAMRYLQSNNLRFKDWHLSALAYNLGERGVQNGIDAIGTRDAWTLIRNGYEGDKDYLPKLMAAIIIMRNPESLD
jgi:beta-lactamase regulating signal transducer with metallopeptidase domain